MTRTLSQQIEQFLDGSPHAGAGASPNPQKYGNMVLRLYMDHGREVFPINPNADEIEGLKSYPDLKSLPNVPHGISIITWPAVTKTIVDQAIESGVKHLWMQPGAESKEAIQRAKDAGMNIIAGGPCILVEWRS